MKIIVVAGPSGCGKTSLIRRLIPFGGARPGVAKIAALSEDEHLRFAGQGINYTVHASRAYCPDHIGFISFADFYYWAENNKLDTLFIETAGLCGRCSPFFEKAAAVCVLPFTANIHLPEKLGPLVENADAVVLTRGDLVSCSERRIFRLATGKAAPRAKLFDVNALTGEGIEPAAHRIMRQPPLSRFISDQIRGGAPRGHCFLCQSPRREEAGEAGQTKIITGK